MSSKVDTNKFIPRFVSHHFSNADQEFESCKLGQKVIPCCAIFQREYSIYRGTCFGLRRDANIYQTSPDKLGQFRIRVYPIPSAFSKSGFQDNTIAYVDEYGPAIAALQPYYIHQNSYSMFRVRQVNNLCLLGRLRLICFLLFQI